MAKKDGEKAVEVKVGLYSYAGKRDERAGKALEKERIEVNTINLSRPPAEKSGNS